MNEEKTAGAETSSVSALAKRALAASRELPALSGAARRKALSAVADALEADVRTILDENAADVEAAVSRGRPASAVSVLDVDEARLLRLVRNVRTVADFSDPVGERVSRWVRPNGLEIERVRVPVGVVGVCAEGRPVSFGFIAAACIKAGDAMVFASDGEAPRTLRALQAAFARGLESAGAPPDAVLLFDAGGRHLAACRELVSLDRVVDVAVLRGSPAFVRDLAEHASIPVLRHPAGPCHVYVDRDRQGGGDVPRVHANDMPRALRIVADSRLFCPHACTSASVALVHADAAPRFLPLLADEAARRGLALVADERAAKFLPGSEKADPADFSLGPEGTALAVGVVDSLQEAVDRINANGARLCDAIATESPDAARAFQRGVDSAIVFVNASTTFADGEQFGMGALVGISTGKVGPRGEIGIEGLTSLKYLVHGTGQTRGRP